jgi:cellulose synthase/poly-beta-1,6-N-acetylglucosamine synthase-like glycosyltransferase
MNANPYITIVFPVGIQRERAEIALAKILDQKDIGIAEVMVIDTAFEKYHPLQSSNHPSVKTISANGTLSFSGLRTKAVENANGEVIAFVEDHAYVTSEWLECLISGFHAGHGGVGGSPENLNPGVGISDLTHVINFGFFPTIAQPQTFTMLPGNNSAYRKDLLLSFGDLLPELFASEVILNWLMIEKGYTLLLDPRACFQHLNETAVSKLKVGYYNVSLCFGETRAKLYKWPWWRRLAQLSITPLVPFARFLKHLMFFQRNKPENVPILLRYSGIFLYAQFLAAIGLAIGCIFGAGDAEVRFSDYELNDDRNP